MNKLAPAIELESALAVCDASVDASSFGSHAYIIQTYDETGDVKGSGPVNCDEDDIESTRATKSWSYGNLIHPSNNCRSMHSKNSLFYTRNYAIILR